MATPYEMFKTKKIDQTVPTIIDYGEFSISIKFGGAGNKSFINATQLRLKQFERRDAMANSGKLSDEAKEALDLQKAAVLAEIYADHIIVGWDGVKDENGKDMKFTRENVIKLFTDIPDLFNDVINSSLDSSNFKEKVEEEEEKN